MTYESSIYSFLCVKIVLKEPRDSKMSTYGVYK